MTLKSLKPLLAGATVATMLAFVAACSGTSSSMNPTGPTAAANSAAAGANFSPNPTTPVCTPPQILNDAGDRLYRSTAPAAGRDSMLAWLLEDPRGRVRGVLHRRRGSAG